MYIYIGCIQSDIAKYMYYINKLTFYGTNNVYHSLLSILKCKSLQKPQVRLKVLLLLGPRKTNTYLNLIAATLSILLKWSCKTTNQ